MTHYEARVEKIVSSATGPLISASTSWTDIHEDLTKVLNGRTPQYRVLHYLDLDNIFANSIVFGLYSSSVDPVARAGRPSNP